METLNDKINELGSACRNWNTRNNWEVCYSMCYNSQKFGTVLGIMCEAENGFVYINHCDKDEEGTEKTRFYVYQMNGAHNPYDDNGKWIKQEWWEYADGWKNAAKQVESKITA